MNEGMKLWNDEEFISRRLKDQFRYITSLKDRYDQPGANIDRLNEIYDSAMGTAVNLQNQLFRLVKQRQKNTKTDTH